MSSRHHLRLGIIGGGYDHLYNVTSLGRSRLSGASLIIYPERIGPDVIERVNSSAALIPYAAGDDPLSSIESRLKNDSYIAVLLNDGVAEESMIDNLDSLVRQGLKFEYYPTVPLWQAACYKAGVFPPTDEKEAQHPSEGPPQHRARTVPGAGTTAKAPTVTTLVKEDFSSDGWLRKTLRSADDLVDAVGFDGRILWPRRILPCGRLPGLAEHLPEGGRLFVIGRGDRTAMSPAGGLVGRGIIITRSREQADDLGLLLAARGATPFFFPTISISDPEDFGPVDRAIDNIRSYNGLIMTSVNAVERFFSRIRHRGLDLRILSGMRVMAVGTKTAAALACAGVVPDAVPEDFRAEGLIGLLEKKGVLGMRFLLPRAEEGRNILPEKIREMGGEIDVIPVYRTVRASTGLCELDSFHRAGLIDAIIFTSGSTFSKFIEILGAVDAGEILRGAALACIGSVTAGIVKGSGYDVAVMPARFTVWDVVESLENYFDPSEDN